MVGIHFVLLRLKEAATLGFAAASDYSGRPEGLGDAAMASKPRTLLLLFFFVSKSLFATTASSESVVIRIGFRLLIGTLVKLMVQFGLKCSACR